MELNSGFESQFNRMVYVEQAGSTISMGEKIGNPFIAASSSATSIQQSSFIDRSFPQVPPPADTGSGFSPISLIISVGKITVTDDVTGTAHPSCWCPSAGMALQRENGREGVGRWPNGL